MKRVFKYATGDEIPEGAEYLSTEVQRQIKTEDREMTDITGPSIGRSYTVPGEWQQCWLVWHYFLVPVLA